MSETLQLVIDYGMMFATLALFVIIANTPAGMQRALTRIADRLDEPVPEKPE